MYHVAENFIMELKRLYNKGLSYENPSVVQINDEDFLRIEIVQHDEYTGDRIANLVWMVKKSEYEECYSEHKKFQTFINLAYLTVTGVPIE